MKKARGVSYARLHPALSAAPGGASNARQHLIRYFIQLSSCFCWPPALALCAWQVVEASDVIIEVLDARDPLGCRCLDVERFVRRSDPTKKIILLLNKIGGQAACQPLSGSSWLPALRSCAGPL